MQAICNTKDSSKGEAFKAAAQLELKKEELKSAKVTKHLAIYPKIR